MKDPRDVILRPVISEKTYGLLDENKYTFVVDPRSNKTEIKQAIEKIFDVKVLSRNTMNRPGKRKRRGWIVGKRPTPSARSSPSPRATRSSCSTPG
jgi:large subunit ribosomal protein L23